MKIPQLLVLVNVFAALPATAASLPTAGADAPISLCGDKGHKTEKAEKALKGDKKEDKKESKDEKSATKGSA